ncbi:methyltransferase domain-containing protein [Telmatospirillum sp.]|uniref:protein-L-isoaspartate O-methyltransferase family protein n=1 Tax=Telmatospirillum sp. TaxID=2079197 RepID=UPI002843E625|nr:methyltransferase domain-containing protein [Telmatospirillum sp.]MDR3439673.1 methyltransferase domain-containing protein [Telmatospirillum sp.]
MDGAWVDERVYYTKELAVHGGLRSSALLRAFSAVPRERFLPPGPWILEASDGSYYSTEDDDVGHVLHAVGVAIDVTRHLNSANPATVGRTLEAAKIEGGDTILHVGAGLGYFSAVMAEMVGPSGRVIAAEVDPDLRAQARANLAPWTNVEVVGDALTCPLPPLDVVFSSAGVADVPQGWVKALRPGGRMILPITGSLDGGFLFRFERAAEMSWLSAEARSFVRFFPCQGARSIGQLTALDKAIADPRANLVRHLRLDHHEFESQCWLHNDDWCLSTRDSPHEGADQF